MVLIKNSLKIIKNIIKILKNYYFIKSTLSYIMLFNPNLRLKNKKTTQESQDSDKLKDTCSKKTTKCCDKTGATIYSIFHMTLSLIACYLSWKCNGERFDFNHILVAILCPYILLIYLLSNKGTCYNVPPLILVPGKP